MALKAEQRLTVFSVKKDRNGNMRWTRSGVAFVNKDDSVNVRLDVLPLEGWLHCRPQVVDVPDVVVVPARQVRDDLTDLAMAKVEGNS